MTGAVLWPDFTIQDNRGAFCFVFTRVGGGFDSHRLHQHILILLGFLNGRVAPPCPKTTLCGGPLPDSGQKVYLDMTVTQENH